MSRAQELFIYRGLPGSGKTTRAKGLQASTGGVLAGRDHIRALLFGGYQYGEDPDSEQEKRVTETQDRMIREGLRSGNSVIVDDMNLKQRYVRRLVKIAHEEGSEVSVIDLTDVHPAECEYRNGRRDRQVPPAVIQDLWTRFIKGQPYPLPMPEVAEEKRTKPQTYVPPKYGRDTVIVDIDGTVAKMTGRSPYDYTRVSEDVPNGPVVDLVKTLDATGTHIVFVSGRPSSCRQDTYDWLVKTFPDLTAFSLFMRKTGDNRNDAIVKREIFDNEIRETCNVKLVLDDRNRVVDMWRSLGITCLQVAEGDF